MAGEAEINSNAISPERAVQDSIREQYSNPSNLKARIALFGPQTTTAFWNNIKNYYEFLPGERCLEVGAGTGQFWKEVCERVPREFEIVLTDKSKGMIAESRSNLLESPLKIAYQIADAQALGFAEKSFDWVLAHFMLYHLSDPVMSIGEFRRVIKDSGHLGVILPRLDLSLGKEPRYIEMALQLEPDLRPSYKKFCQVNFASSEFVRAASPNFLIEKEMVFRNIIPQPDVETIESALFSLPTFQPLVSNSNFREKYREQIVQSFNGGAVFEIESDLSLFICRPKGA